MYLITRRVLKTMMAIGLLMVSIANLYTVIAQPNVASFAYHLIDFLQVVGGVVLALAFTSTMAVGIGCAFRLSHD